MGQTRACRGDLAYVMEPTKERGPFLEPNDAMNELVVHRFELEESLQLGQQTTLIYRLDRAVMEGIAAGGEVWLQSPVNMD